MMWDSAGKGSANRLQLLKRLMLPGAAATLMAALIGLTCMERITTPADDSEPIETPADQVPDGLYLSAQECEGSATIVFPETLNARSVREDAILRLEELLSTDRGDDDLLHAIGYFI